MATPTRRAACALSVVAAMTIAACDAGPGTELGPSLPPFPTANSKAVVLDDQGRGVVGAVVEVAGGRAATNRNGRADLPVEPRGTQLVRVDATAAAATSGDRLASYTVALAFVSRDLPEVLYVPDLPDAASATLPTGVQTAAATIATSTGEQLAIAPGSNLAAGAATEVAVRLGTLQPQHLPGALPRPTAASEAFVWSRGVYVAPAELACTPAIDLSAPDDFGFAGAPSSAAPRLFRLDATTGAWSEVPVAVAIVAGRLVAAGAVDQGGLYAFAAPATAGAVEGRVVDAAATSPGAVPIALVRVDHVRTSSDGQGRFRADGVPITTPAGGPRSAAIAVFAGGTWLPAAASRVAALSGPANTVADIALDTRPSTNLYVQQVRRGRAEAFQPVRASSLRGGVALVTTGDADGFAVLDDLPSGYAGFADGRVGGREDIVYGRSVRFFDSGRRWSGQTQYFADRNWSASGRRTVVYACDALGGGPLEGVDVMQGASPGGGRLDETRESGSLSVQRSVDGRATGVSDTSRGGQRVVHAFSIQSPSSDLLELPLQVARTSSVGAFERFGLVAGAIPGADPARGHALRATRRIGAQEWWDDVVAGVPAAALPLDVDPATTPDRYAAGVPAVGGHVAIAEYVAATGVAPRTLGKLGLALDLAPTEGATLPRDVPLDFVADASFPVAGALLDAPPELDVSQLTMALALQQPSGRVVDVARGLQGNHAAVGDDLVFTLPPLAGALAGHGWLALLDGAFAGVDGATRRVTALVSLPRGAAPTNVPQGDVRFRPFPVVTAPAANSAVAAAGFPVAFTLPSGALHGWIEVRAVAGAAAGETLLWQVAIPPTATQFAFVALPTGVVSPFRAGVEYELSVSALFADGPATASSRAYQDVAGYLRSIGPVERGVAQVVRTSVRVTMQ